MSTGGNPISHALATMRCDLSDAATPAALRSAERLVPGTKAIGVPVPEIRRLAAAWHAELKDITVVQLCEVVDELIAGGVREEILLGAFLMGRRGKRITEVPWPRIARWIPKLNDWETCDQLASNVSGPVVASDPKLVSKLEALAKNENQWRRRFAIATVSELNHRGRYFPDETFRVCRLVLCDPQPMVRKAVGWALRECGKHGSEALVAFLRIHAKEAHPQVIREATGKLPRELGDELVALARSR
ncbi:MAG: DNA alkylation repair protein [Thermoanaerobaculia bacterium]|nr:DNA alkylation repair protein [Thermoanaerobaculia bacterium]